MKVFIDGNFIDGCVDFDDRIRAVKTGLTGNCLSGPEGTSPVNHYLYGSENFYGIDTNGCYLIPGLVDIHTHGALGEDASDGNPEGLYTLSRYYAKNGVTSWCPTVMTLSEPDIMRAVKAIGDFVPPDDGAGVAGINLEGPFLSRAKCGAQNPDFLHAPDASMLDRINKAAGGKVRLVSVAPEEPGALDFIREVSKYCTVSIGHTNADYDTAMAAFDAGASHVTHLFNAMPELLHRAPGVVGAAFDAGATVELITDGLHVDPAVIRMAYKLFGKRLVLISDSLRCAGMPDGDYELGGQKITMKYGKATLAGTGTLAGSSISLMEGLRRAVSFGIPLEDAVAAATITPAKVIGMDDEIGSIEPGKWADFVLLDRDLNTRAVFKHGRRVR